MIEGKSSEKVVGITGHKIENEYIFYNVTIETPNHEKVTEWRKSDELTCAESVFEYWKKPRQFHGDITNQNANGEIKEENEVFETKKESIQILGLSPLNGRIIFAVRFPDSKNEQLIDATELRARYPNELIDFYRSHARIVS